MAGVDLSTVRELMGHKTITIMQRYAHLSAAQVECRAAARISHNRHHARSR
jgi:site-specific recombinase XerD